MKKTSPTILADITQQLNQGKSLRNIAKAIGISKTTIGKVRTNLNPNIPKSKGGAPSKLSPRERRKVTKLIQEKGIKSAVEVTQLVNQDRNDKISSATIRRALHKENFSVYKKVKKPLLLARHRKARVDWCKAHQEWTKHDWMRVIWSDETKINRFGSDRQQLVWQKKGEGLSNRRCQPTVKFGGGGIMVWGCMSWAGIGKIAMIEGKMNASQYCTILETSLIPSIQSYSFIGSPSQDQVIFQQDNDPKHTSNQAKDWFKEKKIQVMSWPAQSPDLNPIEHLWGILKEKLRKYSTPAKGVHELWERTKYEWDQITIEECRKLIESLPKRCRAVIKAKGGPTKY